jgi:hypothetical protein
MIYDRPTMPPSRSLLLLSGLAMGFAVASTIVAACASNETAAVETTSDATADSPRPAVDGGATEQDAGSPSTCALTRAYTTACNKLLPDGGDQLTCGDAKFDAWCDLNDKAINSAAFRRAEALCLTTANCDSLARRDCEYRSYATATPTAAQKQVVAAYCQMCEPADPGGCASRKTTYNPALGPKSTDDVFVAAWELNDPLADAIRTGCTSPADGGAGPDAGACLKSFASCAGGLYIDRLPNCP